jgi:hypothetical protein
MSIIKPTKYIVTKLPVHNNKLSEPVYVGEILHTCMKNGYGSASEDSNLHGEKFIIVTRSETGDYPFITMPVSCLRQLPS